MTIERENGLYWSITDVDIDTSPTGEYSIKKYWTDIGGWGWKGKVYLVKHGFIDKKYWICFISVI
ncbi:MAG: hypothetical protein LBL49_10155 [Clostridiales Family XIII bacterium]|jgi:hypothetical protein|nr:hypothetical protein [Clostridiales Family XIII bacterium]